MNRSHTPIAFSPASPSPTPRSQRFHLGPFVPSSASSSRSTTPTSDLYHINDQSQLHPNTIETDSEERRRIALEHDLRQRIDSFSLDPSSGVGEWSVEYGRGQEGEESLRFGDGVSGEEEGEGVSPTRSGLHPTGRTPLRVHPYDDETREMNSSAWRGARDGESTYRDERSTAPGNLTSELANLLRPSQRPLPQQSRKPSTTSPRAHHAAPSPFAAPPPRPSAPTPSRPSPAPAEHEPAGGRTVDGARLPDITGATEAFESPAKGGAGHAGLMGGRKTRLGREDETAILASLRSLETRLGLLTSENASSRTRVAELELELARCRDEAARAARSARDEVKAWEVKCEELRVEKDALERLTQTLRVALDKLQSELAAQSARVDELLSARERDAAALKRRDEEIGWLRAEVARLGAEVKGVWEALRAERESREREKERTVRIRSPTPETAAPAAAQAPPITVTEPSTSSAPPSPPPAPAPAQAISPIPPRPKFNKSVQATPSSFFASPTRDRAARLHPSAAAPVAPLSPAAAPAAPAPTSVNSIPLLPTTSTPGRTPRSRSVRKSRDAPEPEQEGEEPFPSIRGEKLERLFWAPSSSRKEKKKEKEREKEKEAVDVSVAFVEGLVERMGREREKAGAGAGAGFEKGTEKGWETKVPPQTVLARVVRELEDDFGRYKGIYTELAEQYRLMDPASAAGKRRVLAGHLREVIDVLEKKADQISSLYQLLKFSDRSIPPSASHAAASSKAAAAKEKEDEKDTDKTPRRRERQREREGGVAV